MTLQVYFNQWINSVCSVLILQPIQQMKSRNKKEIQLKRSIQKRTGSYKRLANPQATPNTHLHAAESLSKCQTSRTAWKNQPKLNNFLRKVGAYQSGFQSSNPLTKRQKFSKQIQHNEYQQLLLKRSDKMKLVYWNSDPSLVGLKKIAVSADFIVDQDCFWQKEKPQEQKSEVKLLSKSLGEMGQNPSVKQWKQLHRNFFVIWIVRNRRSWQRIQSWINQSNLQIHGIYLVKKKRNYTVDYSPIERQIMKHQIILTPIDAENMPQKETRYHGVLKDSLIIFETIKLNTRDLLQFKSLSGKVPIILNRRTKVLFMRIDKNPPGLQNINRYLQNLKKPQSAMISDYLASSRLRPDSSKRQIGEVVPMSTVRHYIDKYLKQKQKQEVQQRQEQQPDEDWFYEEEMIQQKIQSMKRNLIDELIRTQGRNFQFEGGISIYNMVGEMFKRNYKIMFESVVQIEFSEQKLKKKSILPQSFNKRQSFDQICLDFQIDYYQIR